LATFFAKLILSTYQMPLRVMGKEMFQQWEGADGKLSVIASLNEKFVKQDVSNDGACRRSNIGKWVGKNWFTLRNDKVGSDQA
jgi:hypothetical protein